MIYNAFAATVDDFDQRRDENLPVTTEFDELILPPDIEGSQVLSPSSDGGMLMPTSTIVYNATSAPVTSLYIYEVSSSDVITKSFLAGDDYIIKASPTVPSEMGKTNHVISTSWINSIHSLKIPLTMDRWCLQRWFHWFHHWSSRFQWQLSLRVRWTFC